MPLNITQHAVTDRPMIASGRAGTSILPALVEEVMPLIKEAVKLSADKALPLVVPDGERDDLVRALRAAGDKEGVTVRFKRFPRYDPEGNRVTRVREKDGHETPLSDPYEPAGRNKSRVTFWTTKKVQRKRRTKSD